MAVEGVQMRFAPRLMLEVPRCISRIGPGANQLPSVAAYAIGNKGIRSATSTRRDLVVGSRIGFARAARCAHHGGSAAGMEQQPAIEHGC